MSWTLLKNFLTVPCDIKVFLNWLVSTEAYMIKTSSPKDNAQAFARGKPRGVCWIFGEG